VTQSALEGDGCVHSFIGNLVPVDFFVLDKY